MDALETKPVKVYDISTPRPQAGTMAPHEVQDAVQSGRFSLPKGEQVNVLNPEGTLGTIDASEAPEAFKNGYSYATPDKINNIRFGSGIEQSKAALEGFAEGVAGPLAPLAETKLFGAKPENIRARAEANPVSNTAGKIAGLGAGLMTGTGEGALLDMAGNAAVHGLGVESSIARGAAKAATEMALMSSGDEVSKMILHDPNQSIESAISNIGLSGLIGAGGGAALGAISPLYKAATESKLGQFIDEMKNSLEDHVNKASQVLSPQTRQIFDPFTKTLTDKTMEILPNAERAGIDPFTKEALPSVAPEITEEVQSAGSKTMNSLINKGIEKITGHGLASTIGAAAGSVVGHPVIGAMIGERALGPFLESVLPGIIKPVLERAVDSGAFKAAAEYGLAIAKGEAMINKATAGLFKPGAEVVAQNTLLDDKGREKLDRKLQEHESKPEGLMNVGGKATYYMPHHDMAIGETTGRVVSYLNSIRPRVEKQAPLDPVLKPSNEAIAEFHKALNVAEQPLSVVKDIKDGTIRPQDVEHLQKMYPALYRRIAMGLHSDLINHVDNENPVPYKTRLGLSLFLREPMDSSISQPQIMAAQATFQPPAPPPQQAMNQKPKGSMKDLGKMASQYQTPEQARIKDRSTV